MQDRGGGDVNELVSKEDYEELLDRKMEQMKKKNEELRKRHLVCNVTVIVFSSLHFN